MADRSPLNGSFSFSNGPVSASSAELPYFPSRNPSGTRIKTFNSSGQPRSSNDLSPSPTRSPSKHSLGSKSPSSVSKSSSFTAAPPSRRPSSAAGESVKETNVMVRDYDTKTGNKIINTYMIIRELGRGCHGKVKLCIDMETREQWALKIVQKKARPRFQSRLLSNRLAAANQSMKGGGGVVIPNNPELEKIKREIAILKKCNHPHVVGLKEVIDDPNSDKIYLVLEYLTGGDIRWHDQSDPMQPLLSIYLARNVFRDVICGVEYLHYQGIVHRDIKPANLLWTTDGRVKISDFGVSVVIRPDYLEASESSLEQLRSNELELAKTAGTPAFFAPEMCGITDDEEGDPRPYSPVSTNGSESWRIHTGCTNSAGPATPVRGLSGQSNSSQSNQPGNATTENLSDGTTREDFGILTSSPIPIIRRKSSRQFRVWAGAEPVREDEEDATGVPAGQAEPHALCASPVPGETISSSAMPLPSSSLPSDAAFTSTIPTPSSTFSLPNPPFSAPAASTASNFHGLPIGKAIDIWAIGVTLYCLVFGRLPFTAESEFELFNVISRKPLTFPDNVIIDDDLKDLLNRLLDKDPVSRITLEEIKLHKWTTSDLSEDERQQWLLLTDPTLQYGGPVEVTEDDLRGAVTIMSRIRERIRKLSSSFHNLAAGLRRKPKNYASDDHIAQSIQTLVKQSSEQRGDRDKSRPSTAGSSTGHRSLGRRRSPLSGGASSSDSLDKVQSASRSVALDSPRLCADPGEIPQVILSQQPEWFRWGIAGRPGQAAAFGTAAGTPPFDSTIPHPQPVHAHHEDQDPNSSTDDIYITSAEATDDENDDTGAQAERERLRQFARAYGEDLDGGREDESSDGGGLEMSGTGVIIIDDRENEE